MTAEQQKAFGILESIVGTALAVKDAVSKLPSKRKKILKSINRTPKKRIDKNKAWWDLVTSITFGAADLHVKTITPISKDNFKDGGISILGETAYE